MPFLSRLFVKTGILYLLVTFIAGAVMLSLEALGHGIPPIIGIEHGHAGFVGWLVNTVIGIAYWLLPLNRARFPAAQGRYPERMALASYVLLNAGLIVRLLCEPWYVLHPNAAASILLLASAVLQVGGIAAFAWIGWQRLYPPPLRPEV